MSPSRQLYLAFDVGLSQETAAFPGRAWVDLVPPASYWGSYHDRDRTLFKRYIPIIKELNEARWRPTTFASTSDPDVYLERFGSWPGLYFTLRNASDRRVTATVSADRALADLPPRLAARSLLTDTRVR